MRSFNLRTEVYANTIYGYYGQSTLYRILRPIAIAEIIEQQITYADFSIDQTAIGLLRFKKAAYMALTDGKPILDHPKIDWSRQKEHLYSGTLGNLAYSLIVEDEDASVKSRPMQFHEFQVFIEKPGNLNLFAPLTNILDDFSIEMKPIFWIRLISLGYICNEYVKREGRDIGFETSYFNLRNLILASKDEFICSHIDEYEKAVQALPNTSL